MQARFTTTVTPQDAVGYVDVLIVGAGISGLDAAYRLTERDPHLTHAILERRANRRYVGFVPLPRRALRQQHLHAVPSFRAVDPEGSRRRRRIREYLIAAAHKYGIDRRIQFNSYVRSADWDSSTDTWTVTFEQDGARKQYHSRFVFFRSGYYNYDEG